MVDVVADKLRNALYEVIRKQIAENDPAETKATWDRLVCAGYSEEETMKMIGGVVISEIYNVTEKDEPYDEARYIAALEKLPDLPWEK